MSKVRNRSRTEITVRERVFEIERIVWKGSDGLSFDVTDVATRQCLTAESFDDEPGIDEIEQLLDNLRDDLDSDSLDFYFKGEEETLRGVVGFTPDGGEEVYDHSRAKEDARNAAFDDAKDEVVMPYGRCDTCGAGCDELGCTTDRGHDIALEG